MIQCNLNRCDSTGGVSVMQRAFHQTRSISNFQRRIFKHYLIICPPGVTKLWELVSSTNPNMRKVIFTCCGNVKALSLPFVWVRFKLAIADHCCTIQNTFIIILQLNSILCYQWILKGIGKIPQANRNRNTVCTKKCNLRILICIRHWSGPIVFQDGENPSCFCDFSRFLGSEKGLQINLLKPRGNFT
jgi:hypothetical protein